MSRLDMTKNDFRALTAVCWAAVIVAPLVLLIGPLHSWFTGDAIARELVRDEAVSLTSGPGTEATVGSTTVALADPSVPLRLLDLATVGLVVAAVIVVGTAMLTLSARTRTGEPFDRVTVAALRRISLTLILLPPVHSIVDSIVRSRLGQRAFGDEPFVGVSVTDWGVAVIFIGVAFAILAESFRIGIRLREDAEGLV